MDLMSVKGKFSELELPQKNRHDILITNKLFVVVCSWSLLRWFTWAILLLRVSLQVRK